MNILDKRGGFKRELNSGFKREINSGFKREITLTRCREKKIFRSGLLLLLF